MKKNDIIAVLIIVAIFSGIVIFSTIKGSNDIKREEAIRKEIEERDKKQSQEIQTRIIYSDGSTSEYSTTGDYHKSKKLYNGSRTGEDVEKEYEAAGGIRDFKAEARGEKLFKSEDGYFYYNYR